jgi:small-conductance mechanosensitive channel
MLHAAMTVVATFFVLRIVTAIVTEFIQSFINQRENGQTKQKQARGLVIVINVAIWVLGIVFLIDNFGYDVTALVAGLGIGGIAIALAAQTILGDLFSYFVIFFDRPFEVGDFIIVDDKMGEIEYVGVKTTRIKTLSGEQLVCSNTDLTNSRVHNYKRMQKRRVLFKLGVVYQTPHAALKEIPGTIRKIIESKSDVNFDRGHFSGFGASSLDFEFVYYVSGADYNFYMDVQQSIYLDIVEAFEQHKIEFAYPTQTLFVQPNPAPAGAENN